MFIDNYKLPDKGSMKIDKTTLSFDHLKVCRIKCFCIDISLEIIQYCNTILKELMTYFHAKLNSIPKDWMKWFYLKGIPKLITLMGILSD